MQHHTRLQLALSLMLATACAAGASAQTAVFTPAVPAPGSGNFMIRLAAGRCNALNLNGSNESGEKLNAPYSGVGITEMVNTLADGNRITRKNTMRYFRDSRGRTRTEFELTALGPVALDAKRSMVTIDDPLAKVHFLLHPEDKVASVFEGDGVGGTFVRSGIPGPGMMVTQRVPDGVPPPPPAAGAARERDHVVVVRERLAFGPDRAGGTDRAGCAGQPNATPVPLGERTIEGLKTTGSKLEMVIPAGEIGNELPMTVTTEQWFSPELGVVISSTHQDPMSGSTTYRLTQISRAEPDAKLFTVPADYKRSKLEGARQFQIKVPAPAGRPAQQ